jgi:glycosyltransferase involved in cell wall biosynthesis
LKKILFVINTLGRAGAETALLGLIAHLDPTVYEISLYVLMEQGELISKLPAHVKVENDRFSSVSVLSKNGSSAMKKRVLRAAFSNNSLWRNIFPMLRILFEMIRKKRMQPDKLLWRLISDGAKRLPQEYDLAVAYIEGGSTYYVADHVDAKKKAAFVHIAYQQAGYTRRMDQGAYRKIDAIYAVSDEVKEHFDRFYPEHTHKTEVFHNLLDTDSMLRLSKEPGGFTDTKKGLRLLTVGRLTHQKGYDVAIEAMRLIHEKHPTLRWYVLGDGDKRKDLESQIKQAGLEDFFILLGATNNPYPYYAQADVYVHCTRFEGKSIAIQEARFFNLPIIASNCDGNREQIQDGIDGILCDLTPQAISDAVRKICEEASVRERLRSAVSLDARDESKDLDKLLGLIDTSDNKKKGA